MFYLRNNQGEILIDPTTGLPIRSSDFFDAGYDRQPKYTIGLTNTLRRGRMSLSFLLDIRKGGDVFNATEHYLTQRGLATSTLDREQPRVIRGVLRDGKENSANPTENTIVVVPSIQTNYYTTMSEELFIEKNINWLRLRDVTFSFPLPGRFGKNASGFVTADRSAHADELHRDWIRSSTPIPQPSPGRARKGSTLATSRRRAA